jgi:hypothetical protein
VAFAVNVPDVATPDAFVVAMFPPTAKVPLAPLPGGVNVTVAPLTGFPPASFTITASGAANATLIAPSCPVPLVAMVLAGGPSVFVNEKFAVAVTPITLAFTV